MESNNLEDSYYIAYLEKHTGKEWDKGGVADVSLVDWI